MTQYLLKMIQPVGGTPDPEVLQPIMAKMADLQQRLSDQGSWVFAGGLHQPEAASVVSPDAVVTDGPYAEGREFVGGITIIDVPDLDEALGWAKEYAAASGMAIEVAPFIGGRA